eukprot:scaffold4640_cov263-Pinguiococcus_pyrenoidosus.AAC.1
MSPEMTAPPATLGLEIDAFSPKIATASPIPKSGKHLSRTDTFLLFMPSSKRILQMPLPPGVDSSLARTHSPLRRTLTVDSRLRGSYQARNAISYSPLSSHGAVIMHLISLESFKVTTARSSRFRSSTGSSKRQPLKSGLPTTRLSPSGTVLWSGRCARCTSAPRLGTAEIVKR